MFASRESSAYERYEEYAERAQRNGKRELRAVPAPRHRKKTAPRWGVMLCVGVMAVAAVYILYCQMQLTQLSAQVSVQDQTLDKLTAENVSLSSKQMSSMDMAQVEEYASQKLGMVKMDSAQIEYVELTNPDTVTVAESAISFDKLFAGLARSFSAIVEYIR